jgi:hypothetical protein
MAQGWGDSSPPLSLLTLAVLQITLGSMPGPLMYCPKDLSCKNHFP